MIYIIGTECYNKKNGINRVKIGFTTNLDARLASFQMGCPIELKVITSFPGDMTMEKMIHRRFSKYRSHNSCNWFKLGNEWFDSSKEILSFIKMMKANPNYQLFDEGNLIMQKYMYNAKKYPKDRAILYRQMHIDLKTIKNRITD